MGTKHGLTTFLIFENIKQFSKIKQSLRAYFLKLFLRRVFENIKNTKNMLSENSSLFFKFSVFVFLLCFSDKKIKWKSSIFFLFFLFFRIKNNFQKQ